MSPTHSKLIECPCRFDGVREAARTLRTFLSIHGISPEDLDSWELLLAEAGNNVVEHTPEGKRDEGMLFLVNAWPEAVELTMTDHSQGFDWPDQVSLPGAEAERGRGLYLIETLADSVRYVRGSKENVLILRKDRPAAETASVKVEEMEEMLESMTAELASSYESLSAIFRLTSDVSGKDLTVDGIRVWLRELARIVGADWFVMRTMGSGNQILQTLTTSGGFSVLPLQLGKSAEHVEAKALQEREACWFGDQNPLSKSDPLNAAAFNGSRGVVHPIYVGEEAVGVLTMGLQPGSTSFTSGHLSVIRTSAHFLGMRMRNSRAQSEALQAKLVSRELQVAAGIQQSLFPKELPKVGGIQLAAHSQSVREVGGDFFDAIQFVDENGVLLVIADVMGKGVPAALFAAIFRSQVRARLDLAQRPGELMRWMNKALFADLDGVDMFITAQLVYFDARTRTLTVSSAGHSPLLMVTGASATLLEVWGESPPIGVEEDPMYRETCFKLDRPARLLLYTDGVIETRDSGGSLLGSDKLGKWFRSTAAMGLDADATCAGLKGLISEFQSNAPMSDDVTFLVITEDPEPTAAS